MRKNNSMEHKKIFYRAGYPSYVKKDKIKYIHRDIASEKLGRKLGKNEVVHHKDEDKTNNDPENLIVFRNVSHHTSFHNNDSVELFETKDGSVIVVKEQKVCEHCGGMFEPKESSVRYCTISCGAASRIKANVDPALLAKQVWEFPATTLAKMYNVSDVCIKKCCSK